MVPRRWMSVSCEFETLAQRWIFLFGSEYEGSILELKKNFVSPIYLFLSAHLLCTAIARVEHSNNMILKLPLLLHF